MNDPRLVPPLPLHEPAALRAVADRIAARLTGTDEVVGVVLAGSLAQRRAGPRSDVDLVAVGASDEASVWPTERRLVAGVRLDLEWCAMGALAALAQARRIDALRLRSRHGVSPRLLLALLHPAAPAPLSDPSGALGEVRGTLRQRLSAAQVVAPWLAAQADGLGTRALMAARAALMDAGPGPALILAGWAAEQLAEAPKALPAEDDAQWEDQATVHNDVDLGLGPRIEAARAYWERTLALGAVPLAERLRALGIANPAGLTLVGEPLFYKVQEPTEVGRALADTGLALTWATEELEAGQPWRALRRLWFAGFPTPVLTEGNFPQPVTNRWPALGRGLEKAGYDVEAAIRQVTDITELAALSEAMVARGREFPRASATTARLAIARAERLAADVRQRAVQVWEG